MARRSGRETTSNTATATIHQNICLNLMPIASSTPWAPQEQNNDKPAFRDPGDRAHQASSMSPIAPDFTGYDGLQQHGSMRAQGASIEHCGMFLSLSPPCRHFPEPTTPHPPEPTPPVCTCLTGGHSLTAQPPRARTPPFSSAGRAGAFTCTPMPQRGRAASRQPHHSRQLQHPLHSPALCSCARCRCRPAPKGHKHNPFGCFTHQQCSSDQWAACTTVFACCALVAEPLTERAP